MGFVQALKPQKQKTEGFSVRMTLLSIIAFVVHMSIIYANDSFFIGAHGKLGAVFMLGMFLSVLYLVFIYLPSIYIFRLKLPPIVRDILFVVVALLFFESLVLLPEKVFYEMGNYAIVPLLLFVVMNYYGRLSKGLYDEEK